MGENQFETPNVARQNRIKPANMELNNGNEVEAATLAHDNNSISEAKKQRAIITQTERTGAAEGGKSEIN